jgi:transposase
MAKVIKELQELDELLNRYNELSPEEEARLEVLAEKNEARLRDVAPEFFDVLSALADVRKK